MKIFVINDKEALNREIGYLFCYEKSDDFIIELDGSLDEWSAPVLFSGLVRNGIYTVPKDISRSWVMERIIPSGRQNIGLILKNQKMTEYNEIKLLKASRGFSSQDSCYLKEIKEENLPDWVKERQKNNLEECFLSKDDSVICFSKDGSVRRVILNDYTTDNPKLSTILSNRRILRTVKPDAGGYGIIFNDSITIDKRSIINRANVLDATSDDFYAFVNTNIMNTAEVCQALGCTRQNLSYLVKSGSIKPFKSYEKDNLFMKGEIERYER